MARAALSESGADSPERTRARTSLLVFPRGCGISRADRFGNCYLTIRELWRLIFLSSTNHPIFPRGRAGVPGLGFGGIAKGEAVLRVYHLGGNRGRRAVVCDCGVFVATRLRRQ